MNWKNFINPFRQAEIFKDAAWKIVQSLFEVSGCAKVPSAEAVRSWLYLGRNCRVNAYFPNGKANDKQLFCYFRKRPDGKLQQLQQIFRDPVAHDSDSPIDTGTADLDIFCWSLVNQFLDLLGFQRADIPDSPTLSGGESVRFDQTCEKCCLYCIHWQGDKSTVGPYRMPTRGTCKTHFGKNKIRIRNPLSSSAVCKDYQADQDLIRNMKRVGYNVENLI